jgi:hypothetical protein
MLPSRLLPVLLLLVASPLGGCSSTSNQPHDAAAAPHDATTPHDGTTHVDARDAGSSDGAQAAGIACGDASCVAGQQFCYTLADRRTDAGKTSDVCTTLPASCAHVEAGAACSCVFAATQCQDPNSRVCVMKAGMVLQASCSLK